MSKYRKKPIVIEAYQWIPEGTPTDAPEWFWDYWGRYPELLDGDDLRIKTLEGEMRVSPNDWIIKGIQGELYPCKPDIFVATYELVED